MEYEIFTLPVLVFLWMNLGDETEPQYSPGIGQVSKFSDMYQINLEKSNVLNTNYWKSISLTNIYNKLLCVLMEMTPSKKFHQNMSEKNNPGPEISRSIPDGNSRRRKTGFSGSVPHHPERSRYHEIFRKQRIFITNPPVKPDEFFGIIHQMSSETQRFYALFAAQEIRLFDHLDKPTNLQELHQIYPHQEMIFSLLEILVESKFIQEVEGSYQNSPLTSIYFSSTSPYYQGAYLEKIKKRINDLWVHLPEVIRDGPVVYDKKEFFCTMCLPPMAENAMTGRLQYVIRSIVALPEFLSARQMLDLGGGHGLYAIALASLKQDLHCVIFDLPEVVDTTCDYIIAHNMDEQVKVLPGDFFSDEFGSGYDIILSSSNPSGKNPAMIQKIYESLGPGGIFVNIQSGDADIVENPLSQLESRMWILEGEPEWKSHRGKKQPFLSPVYMKMLQDSGFDITQVETIPDGYIEDYTVTMIICKKKELSKLKPSIQISFQSQNQGGQTIFHST